MRRSTKKTAVLLRFLFYLRFINAEFNDDMHRCKIRT